MGRLPNVLVSLAAGAALACAVGPDYEPPSVEAPEAFDAADASEDVATAELPVVDAWWEGFEDPVLSACVEEAFRANLDLRASLQRVRVARAMRQMESSAYWPQVDARLGYTVDRLSGNNPRFGEAIEQGFFPRDVEYWDVAFDVGWELDVFGGTRRRVEASAARLEETELERGALMQSVAAEVAREVIELSGDQHRLALLDEQIAVERARAQILDHQRQSGVIPATLTLRSTARAQALEARRPSLSGEVRAAQYRLAVLLGRRPDEIPSELAQLRPLPAALGQVPTGLPSELLLRRPDLRAAERRVAAATAEIGVAEADRFPRFFLTGTPYLQSEDFTDLFQSSSTGWTFGPSVSWNLFSAGRNAARVEAAEAQVVGLLLEYEDKVHEVLEEVESSLVRYGHDARALRLSDDALATHRRQVALQSGRHDAGLVDGLELLDAQAARLEAQVGHLDRQVLLLTRLVALHKALGGGWPSAEAIAREAEEARNAQTDDDAATATPTEGP